MISASFIKEIIAKDFEEVGHSYEIIEQVIIIYSRWREIQKLDDFIYLH